MDSAQLADLVNEMSNGSGIDSVTIVRHGHVVVDAVVYPFRADATHAVHSCAKSVVGTLIGIAIDRGLLAGVDVPVVEVLADAAPAVVDERKAAMTVEHLLTMAAGLECRWDGLEDITATDDWTAYILAAPMSEDPGTQFVYCDGVSYLLSTILSEVTGVTAAEFAEEVLFGPLGISDYRWFHSPEGVTDGAGRLELQPADFAKLGELYLRRGLWNGERIVSAEWIDQATMPHIDSLGRYTTSFTKGYGYQWWIGRNGLVLALGLWGQTLIVSPELDLVVVFTAGLPPTRAARAMAFVDTHVYPTVVSEDPLPAEPAGQALLAAAIETAAAEPEPTAVEMPAVATEIDGRRFELADNEWGVLSIELRFGTDTATRSTTTVDDTMMHEIGLDGRYRYHPEERSAARGRWLNDTTFVVEWVDFASADRGTERFTFDDANAVTVRGFSYPRGDHFATTGTAATIVDEQDP